MSAPPPPSRAYANYVLALLSASYVVNYLDRYVLAMLAGPIKAELGISDAEMGFLLGPAFALLYTGLGVPVAWLADRTSRRNLIALGMTVWSAFTAFSGLARSGLEIALARFGVGVGEAAGAAPSHSLIADYFPPERRATALATQALGLHAGIAFGYIAAGWLGYYFGWRTTMVVVGLPGLVLALVVATTVKEPPRKTQIASHQLREVVRFLAGQRAYLYLLAAASFHAMAGYSMAHWGPTFLLRVHGLSLASVGTWLGVFVFFAGGGGALLGGWMADRLGRRDPRWYAWTPAIAAFAVLPFGMGFLLSGSPVAAIACFAPQTLAIALYSPPLYAMNQALARPRMCAMAVAIHLFVVSIIGGGIGPWLVGRASDALRATQGELSIRFALLGVFSLGVCVAGVFYLFAARSLARDFEAARA